jgi:hypothetical protein
MQEERKLSSAATAEDFKHSVLEGQKENKLLLDEEIEVD